MIVKCDKCKSKFDLNTKTLKTYINRMGKTIYVKVDCFMCPQCKHIYIFSVRDDKIDTYMRYREKYLSEGDKRLATKYLESAKAREKSLRKIYIRKLKKEL